MANAISPGRHQQYALQATQFGRQTNARQVRVSGFTRQRCPSVCLYVCTDKQKDIVVA